MKEMVFVCDTFHCANSKVFRTMLQAWWICF